MARLSQPKFYNKAIEIVRSCETQEQLEVAKRAVEQYDSVFMDHCKYNEDYDHEYYMYTLLAEIKTIENILK